MSVSLLFKNNIKKQVGNIYLDAMLSENHSMSASATDHPVEDGSIITDHISINPETVSIEGFITNSPVSLTTEANKVSQNNAVQLGFDELRRLMEARQPVTVVTGLKKYDNMAITSLNIPRSKDQGESLTFTIDLKKITTVKSKTVVISEDQIKGSKKIKNQAQSKRNTGKQTGAPVDDKTLDLYKGLF